MRWYRLIIGSAALLLAARPGLAADPATLSFAQLRAAAHKALRIEARSALATVWTQASELARAPAEPWHVELEASSETYDDRTTRLGGLTFGKTFVFGEAAAARQAETLAQNEAAVAEDATELLRLESELGAIYAAIRRDQAVVGRADAALASLEAGVKLGAGDATAKHKAKITRLKIEAARADAEAASASRRALLKTRLQLPSADFAVEDVEAPESAAMKGDTSSPESRALRARGDVLRHREAAQIDQWTLNGALGVQRDFAGKSTALIAKLALPLGQGAQSARLARELTAERSRIVAQADAADFASALRRERARSDLALANARRIRLQTQRDELDRLLAFAGFAEMVETVRERFEVDTALAAAAHDALIAAIELTLLTTAASH